MSVEASLPEVRVSVPPRHLGRRRTGLASPAWALALLLVSLLVSTVFGCSLGAIRVPPSDVLRSLGSVLGLCDMPSNGAALVAIRFPRVALALLVGSGLGLSGAGLQGVFRNPIVDSGFLGISPGAVLFAVGALVLGGQSLSKVAGGQHVALSSAAFSGALLAVVLVRRLAMVDGRTTVASLLLAGLAVTSIAGALTGLMLYGATDAQVVAVTFWTFGSLGGASWATVLKIAPIFAAGLIFSVRRAHLLDALSLGEAEAGHLGVPVERVKREVVLGAALLVGAQVAVSGLVGFVGLVVPHLVRLWLGSRHRTLLPASALLGAVLVLLADTAARTVVAPAELPLGVVTACLGAPFFLALLLANRRRLA